MTDPGKWTRKVDALIRLAEDQKGTPEGDLAREKLLSILQKHPEVQAYQPLTGFVQREISGADFVRMKQEGISTEGSWTGTNLFDALEKMMEDYFLRMAVSGRKEFKIEIHGTEVHDEGLRALLRKAKEDDDRPSPVPIPKGR